MDALSGSPWTAATLLQAYLASSELLSEELRLSGSRSRAAVLLLAGAWQLTPWKGTCLHRCRTPIAVALHEWRPGLVGAMRMGIKHGSACLGCCWALMLVLFAVGVMNLMAVALLAGFIVVERTVSAGRAVGLLTGAVLVAWGLTAVIP
jgi:predicted metal-binding membrane protein